MMSQSASSQLRQFHYHCLSLLLHAVTFISPFSYPSLFLHSSFVSSSDVGLFLQLHLLLTSSHLSSASACYSLYIWDHQVLTHSPESFWTVMFSKPMLLIPGLI